MMILKYFLVIITNVLLLFIAVGHLHLRVLYPVCVCVCVVHIRAVYQQKMAKRKPALNGKIV